MADDVTIAELPPPPFVRSAGKIPVFTVLEAARFLAKSTRDVGSLRNRLKSAAQSGYIFPRQKPGAGRTTPAYFGIDDLAAAVGVMFPLGDFGVADVEVSGHASRACYAWDDPGNPRPDYLPKHVSPIVGALVGASRGEFWVCRINSFYDERSATRRVFAAVYNIDAPPPDPSQYLAPSYLPRVTCTIALAPLLLSLNRAFERVH